MKKTITIGLLRHSSNSANLGVGALTISNIALIENVAKSLRISVRFKIFQWKDPERDYVVQNNVEVIRLRAKHVFLHPFFLKHICKCNVVFDLSAGDSFSDIYGIKRFIFDSCLKFSTLFVRRKLILSPQTIGPFQRNWVKFIAGLLMKASNTVLTRDGLSTQYLSSFDLKEKLIEATDIAFVLPYDSPEKPKKTDIVNVGINVSGLLFNGGYTGENMFQLKVDYPVMIRLLIRQFQKIDKCQIHLIGHVVPQNMPVENDHLVGMTLVKDFPGVIVAPKFDHPSQAKSYISNMDFFCGSRMHACIAAFSSGVPVLPLAYSRKFEGVFNSVGYSWGADLKKMSDNEVVEMILLAFNRRAELLSHIEKSKIVIEQRLNVYKSVIREAIESKI